MILPRKQGYTLIETTVALAIIGLLTLVLIRGAGTSIKTERFSDEVKAFANDIRQAQVHSYTGQVGTCATSPCYWRGTALNFYNNSAGNKYDSMLLNGSDFTNTSVATDNTQQTGISDPVFAASTSLTAEGLKISAIAVNNAGNSAPSSISLAFLAPDGKSFTSCDDSGTPCAAVTTSTGKPYTGAQNVTFTLTADYVALTGTVIFYPANGKIDVSVK